MTTTNSNTDYRFRFFTISEMANIFGLSRRTLYRFRRDGVGPKYVRIGKKILYRAEDVDGWAKTQSKTRQPRPRKRPTLLQNGLLKGLV